MKKTKIINRISAGVLSLGLAFSAGGFNAFASDSFVIRGEQEVYELEFEKDGIFEVTFMADNNDQVTHGNFMVKYDPDVIQAVVKTENNFENYLGYENSDGEFRKFIDDYSFLNQAIEYVPDRGDSEIDGADGVKTQAELGALRFAVVNYEGSELLPSKNSGKLLTLRFKMIGEGTSQVEVTNIPGIENILYRELGEPVSVETRAVTVKLKGKAAQVNETVSETVTEKATDSEDEENNFAPESKGDFSVVPVDDGKAEQSGFSDTAAFPWAEEAIEELASRGIINGVGDGNFAPESNVKRGDFILMLMNALDIKGEAEAEFDDVAKDAYYANAVCLAKDLGIARGKTEREFCPDELITRQDMTVLAANAIRAKAELEKADLAVLDRFTDSDKLSDYARQSAADMVNAGLLNGTGNKIEPEKNTVRAQAAVIIYNIYNMINE